MAGINEEDKGRSAYEAFSTTDRPGEFLANEATRIARKSETPQWMKGIGKNIMESAKIPLETSEALMTNVRGEQLPGKTLTNQELPSVSAPSPAAPTNSAQPFMPPSPTKSASAPTSNARNDYGINWERDPETKYTEPQAPERDVNAEIDNLIDNLLQDPTSKVTQSMGRGITKTGGLKKKVLNTVLGLYGVRQTGETHKQAALDRVQTNKDRDLYNQERLDIMRESLAERKAAGEDTRDLRKMMQGESVFQKDLNTYGMNKMTGEFNPAFGAFTLGELGRHTDRPEVQRIWGPYEKKRLELEKAKGPMSAEQQRKFRRNYLRERLGIEEE
jgi:hypothetical protein